MSANNNTPRRNPANNGHNGGGGGAATKDKQAKRTPTKPAELTPAEFWRIPPKSAAPSPVTTASDPSALLRSLGRPPLDQNGADRYLAAVAERAAGLATALAVAAGILAQPERD